MIKKKHIRTKRMAAYLTAAALLCSHMAVQGSEPVTEIATETETASEEELVTETEAASEAESVAETEAVSEPEPEAANETEAASEAEPVTETEAVSEPEPEAASEAESVVETEAVSEPESEAASEAEPASEAESVTETEAVSESVTDKGSETEVTELQVEFQSTENEFLTMEEIVGPESLSCNGVTHPVDYEDGVYLLKVPQGTETLQILLGGIQDAEAVGVTKWSGYLAEYEETWLLCPDNLIANTFEREEERYTVFLENYLIDMETLTLEQEAVYGELREEQTYAEIFIYSPEISMVILVEIEGAENPETEELVICMEAETAAQTAAEPEKEISFQTIMLMTSSQPRTLNASAKDIEKIYKATGENLAASAKAYTPKVASINGEWQILGLVRSGQEVEESVYTKYLENVVNTVKEKKGILHKKKYTEYSRVVLALTALGEDVTNVGGYNLLAPLADFDQTVWQGINGAIFALIAFDTHDYEIPTAEEGKNQTTRVKLINHILSLELAGGGFALSGKSADPDITGMAIQALAPYYSENEPVKNAVDRAVKKLSDMQLAEGGYGSYGVVNSESCAQVIVALTALGIDPKEDERFIKNGNSVVDALVSFATKDGAFEHVKGGGTDQMATEQAYYALTAYDHFLNGKNTLYDMSDVALQSDYDKAAAAEAMIEELPDTITDTEETQVQKALEVYQNLTELQQTLISKENSEKLQNALKTLEALKAEKETESESQTQSGAKNEAESETKAGDEGETESETQAGNGGESESETESEKQTDKTHKSEKKKETEEESEKITEKNWEDETEETVEKLPESEKTPSGTTTRVNLVSNSNRTGGTASTSVNTSAESKEEETESESESETESETETETESETEKLSEAVKTVLEYMETLFGSGKDSQKLPEDARDYTDVQLELLGKIDSFYLAFSKEEQEQIKESPYYDVYRQVLEQLRLENHYDEASGVDLRDNEEEILPWYVKMEVTKELLSGTQLESIKTILKRNGEDYPFYEIRFINLIDGRAWQPEELLRVRMPIAVQGEYENLLAVHIGEEGKIELIEGHISASNVEFDTDEFSIFGIVDYDGTWEELMSRMTEEEAENWIYDATKAAGATALVLLLLMLLIRKKTRKVKA